MFVDAERLAGWIGRVIPRAVVPPTGGPIGAMCVECTGEGVVLVEPAPEGTPAHVVVAMPPKPPRVASATLEPAPPPEAPLPARGCRDLRASPPRARDDPDAAIDGLDRLRRALMARLAPLEATARLARPPWPRAARTPRATTTGSARWSFVAAEPSATLIARGRSLVVLDRDGRPDASIHRRSVRRGRGVPRRARLHARARAIGGPPEPRVIGYLGYDLARVVERLPARGPRSVMTCPICGSPPTTRSALAAR